MNSAMKLAFDAANYIEPKEKARADLMEVGIEAWRKWSKEDGAGARRQHVIGRLRHDQTWILLEQCQPAALQLGVTWLLNEARDLIGNAPRHAEQSASGEGQSRGDTHSTDALSAKPRNAGRPADDAGQLIQDTQRWPARVVPPSREHAKPPGQRGSEPAKSGSAPRTVAPAAPTLSQRERDLQRVRATLIVERRLSRLDTVLIDGVAIGSRTVGEVRAWATRRSQDASAANRDARFALALVANLPSNELIKNWIKPEEADAAWAKAESEYAS